MSQIFVIFIWFDNPDIQKDMFLKYIFNQFMSNCLAKEGVI